MQQHSSKYFARRSPSPNPTDGVSRSKFKSGIKLSLFNIFLARMKLARQPGAVLAFIPDR